MDQLECLSLNKADHVLLQVQVQPGSKKNAVVGLHAGRLKLKVAAPAVEGKANAELLNYLAELLGVKLKDLSITQGETSRQKTLCVTGLSLDAANERLTNQL